MYRLARIRTVLLISSLVAVTVVCAGCPSTGSVLEGKWELTVPNNPNPALSQIFLTFDASGTLTTITLVFNNATFVRDVPAGSSTSTVSGDQVTVNVSFAGPTTLNFAGTLNGDNTVIQGTVQYSFTFGATTVTIGNGVPATLTLDP